MTYLFDGFLSTAVTLLIAFALGAVLRGLLGSQPARWRCFVVALATFIVLAEIAVPLTSAVGIRTTDQGLSPQSVGLWVVVMAFATAGMAALALGVLVLWEALLPTGKFGRFTDMAVTLSRTLRRHLRYLQLGWIAVTSGLWSAAAAGPDSPRFAEALVRMLERAGPTFIKVGQVLSTRAEAIPLALATALSRLQADVPALPTDVVLRELQTAWGKPASDVLGSFEETPLAAASLAQVHAATLTDGTPVVVKVRRPGSVDRVRTDCDIMMRFAHTATGRWEWAQNLNVVSLAEGLRGSLLEELDYRQEARNTRLCAATLASDPRFVVPKITDDLSGANVLVMQRLFGRTPAVAAPDLSSDERADIARALMRATVLGIFDAGIFHADLHPGNILVLDDGRIGLLDFGAVGVIDPETRRMLAVLVLALLADDDIAAASALGLAFRVSPTTDRDAMRRDLGRLMTLHLHGPLEVPAVAADLFSFFGRHGITVPGDVAGAFRTITSLQGSLTALDPSLDLVAELQATMPAIVRRGLDPKRTSARILAEAAVALDVARRLPERVERVSTQLADGSFTLRTRPFADQKDRSWTAGIVIDGVSGILSATLLAVSAWLVTAPGSPIIPDTQIGLFPALGGASAIIGATLAFRLLIRLFRR